MNKEEYKRLLQLRKSEEEMFFYVIQLTGKTPRELINSLPINHKRAWYLLEKWADQGRYDYGVSLDLGWVTKKVEHLDLKEGGFVKHLHEEDVYGTVEWSRFGYSIHYISKADGQEIYSKTLGAAPHEIRLNWEPVKKLPKGWHIDEKGWPRKLPTN